MPTKTFIDADIADTNFDPDVAAIEEALNPPRLPDREVISPRYDCRGRLLPLYRIWMNDGYTVLKHARTPGEACGLAIEDAKALIEAISVKHCMSPRERRLATTVDCWQQL